LGAILAKDFQIISKELNNLTSKRKLFVEKNERKIR